MRYGPGSSPGAERHGDGLDLDSNEYGMNQYQRDFLESDEYHNENADEDHKDEGVAEEVVSKFM